MTKRRAPGCVNVLVKVLQSLEATASPNSPLYIYIVIHTCRVLIGSKRFANRRVPLPFATMKIRRRRRPLTHPAKRAHACRRSARRPSKAMEVSLPSRPMSKLASSSCPHCSRGRTLTRRYSTPVTSSRSQKWKSFRRSTSIS